MEKLRNENAQLRREMQGLRNVQSQTLEKLADLIRENRVTKR